MLHSFVRTAALMPVREYYRTHTSALLSKHTKHARKAWRAASAIDHKRASGRAPAPEPRGLALRERKPLQPAELIAQFACIGTSAPLLCS
eukprot:6183576-Pleurochrysis_carterae.AAC.3